MGTRATPFQAPFKCGWSSQQRFAKADTAAHAIGLLPSGDTGPCRIGSAACAIIPLQGVTSPFTVCDWAALGSPFVLPKVFHHPSHYINMPVERVMRQPREQTEVVRAE